MKNLEELRNGLKKKCEEHGFEIEHFEGEHDRYSSINFPAGREKRYVFLEHADDFKDMLSIEFYKYVFLNRYEAICSYENSLIESIIQPIAQTSLPASYRYLLGAVPDRENFDPYERSLQIAHPGQPTKTIELGAISRDLEILTKKKARPLPHLGLKLKGFPISGHDQATETLEKVANSIFFEVELLLGVPFGLMPVEDLPVEIEMKKKQKRILRMNFPAREFDKDSLSLYWYARSAHGLPLLQFLAFYQAIEFYFPTYSQSDARRRIGNILKDPSFRVDRDADLGKILTVIRAKSMVFGDERSQLRATLTECIDPDDLQGFFQDEKLKKFFSAKTKGLTDEIIPFADKNADLRTSVANRIYDIRCKIVHTKAQESEGEVQLLLPFSKEAGLLRYDIELLAYLAQRVIIAGSSPLRS